MIILFRALNLISDKDIIRRICYDPNDRHMMEALKPSLEESADIKKREDALDFIGRRGNT